MMDVRSVLRELLTTSRLIVDRYISDMTCSELLSRPGKVANPSLWQLGHLIASEVEMLELIGHPYLGVMPEHFTELHKKGSCPKSWGENITDESFHLPYLQLMKDVRTFTHQVLGAMTDDEFGQPAPEKMRSYAEVKGSIFSMIALHECLHAGQLAVLRRELNKPIVL